MGKVISSLGHWVIRLPFYCFITLLLYWPIGFLSPSPVLAQLCGAAGPKIAGNIDPSNYAQIREQYDQVGCGGQTIPVTIIYTIADLSPEHQAETLANLQAMQEYNLQPIIRISSDSYSASGGWATITPDQAETAGQILNQLLSQVSFSSTVDVYFGNEPDLAYEWGGSVDPVSFGESLAAFILGAGETSRSFNILVTPMATHTGQVNFPFLDTVLNTIVTGSLTIADLVDGAAFTIYGENSQAVSQQYQALVNFMVQRGIPNNFVITELGPLYQGALLQDESDINRWVSIMESIFKDFIANHDLFPDVKFITTSFFLDVDGDGHPDITLLVIITADGDIIILQLATLGGGYLYMSPSPFESLVCIKDLEGERDSRPYRYSDPECNLCNMTNRYCPSCATSFTVGSEVKWQWKDRDCANGGDWVIKRWGGDVIIDPSETTIPFVGKKQNEDERLYLADYFDGTNEYYKNFNLYWRDWINHAGVLRKLTPMDYQDILKEEMVDKAVNATAELHEGNIHDYNLNYIGRLCWDLPFLGDIFLALAQRWNVPGSEFIANHAHYCLFSSESLNPFDDALIAGIHGIIEGFNNVVPEPLKISHRHTGGVINDLSALDGHFPPRPDEEDYMERWQAWKKTPEGRLWEVVPMTSREDTPGWIQPYYAYKYRDDPQFIDPRIEKVPHVARLYESTLEIQDILFPSTRGGFISQKEENPFCAAPQTSEPIIAAPSQPNVQGEKILLAQNEGCFHLEAYASYNNGQVNVTVCFVSDGGDGDITLTTNGVMTGVNRWNMAGGPFCYGPAYTGSPYNVSPSGSASATYLGHVFNSAACPDNYDSITCNFSFDAEGNFTTNCEGGPAAPPPTCEIPPSTISIPNCAMDSITDENPNDDLCCEEIVLDMTFLDSFNDYPYTPCEWIRVCEPNPYPPPFQICWRELLNPECENWEYRTVTRRWGINLSHPYLTQIWEQTAKDETNGIFNFFRPSEIPEFEELDAHSTIDYEFTGGWERPSDGKFYYNYLGGVQKAKEWVTTKALMPYEE